MNQENMSVAFTRMSRYGFMLTILDIERLTSVFAKKLFQRGISSITFRIVKPFGFVATLIPISVFARFRGMLTQAEELTPGVKEWRKTSYGP